MHELYAAIIKKISAGEPLSLVTIVETKDSSPQVAGASALFTPKGLLFGTVGGGQLEASVQAKSLECLQKKESTLFEFLMYGEGETDEESICGGEVLVLIDGCPEKHKHTFDSLAESIQRRQPGVLVTSIRVIDQDSVSISREWVERNKILHPKAGAAQIPRRDEIKKSFRSEIPQLLKSEERMLFLEPIFSRYQLLIAGAGHVGQAVAHLGNLLNFEVTVIDDREEYADKERVPEADNIIVSDISRAIRDFSITDETFIVIVTRGHAHDAQALRECVRSEAAYIGMIGSDRKIKIMRKNFIDKGWASEDQFDKVYAPIGIDIQSKTVQEIAVSIAAQLVRVRNRVRDRSGDSS
jgi:xanthine dehydrogenase accessory factor